jgi:hypothetical protein
MVQRKRYGFSTLTSVLVDREGVRLGHPELLGVAVKELPGLPGPFGVDRDQALEKVR